MANIFNPDWEELPKSTPEGFTTRGASVGSQAGAEELGASVYELAPGEATFPYHFHYGNEEMLIVLAGRPTLRDPSGARELEPGEVVAFRTGPEGAHRLDNHGDEPARILMISTMRSPEVVVYPDSDKVGARSWHHTGYERMRLNFRSGDAVGYWEGET